MELFDPNPSYKSYHEDTRTYLDQLMNNGLVESGLHKKLGLSPYQIANQPIFEAYAKKDLWSVMARDYLIHSHDYEYDLRISAGLVKLKDFGHLQQIWRTYLATARNWYWNNRAQLGQTLTKPATGDSADKWQDVKTRSIAAFKIYRGYVEQLSRERELAWIEEEIELLSQEEKRKPRHKKPRADKIDDILFWSIIENARAESGGSNDLFNQNIIDQLQDFKSTEIKRFQYTMLDKIEDINHWSLWALAFISQSGCSDDGFLYFRAWLISLGKNTYEQAIIDFRSMMELVPADGLVENEGLLYAAFEAYDIRSGGKEMELKERKDLPPKGEPWDENDLERKFPDFAKYFNK